MTIISSFYAALLAIIYFVLMLQVVQARWTQKVGLGHGESKHLQKRIRIHGNFAENIPYTLILFLLVEMQSIFSATCLHVCGVLLVISRLLHIIGIKQSSGTSFGRSVGSTLNQVINMVFAIALIYAYITK